jgi:hypothetical protein
MDHADIDHPLSKALLTSAVVRLTQIISVLITSLLERQQ